MKTVKNSVDLSDKIKTALDKAVKKIIREEKNRDGFLVVGDNAGNIKKIPAKDL